MKYIESEILTIILKGKKPETTAKNIYKKMLKYFKKCCNTDCDYNCEYVCNFFKNGQTVSCSNQRQKEEVKIASTKNS